MLFALQNHQISRRPGRQGHRKTSAGFSLIEVLVAGTVFSLGLAGFSALLLSNIISSAQARQAGIVSIAAANLSEQIRMNPDALERYLEPPEYVSKICTGDAMCSPEQQADYDFKLWQLELADRIHNARGLVCRDETPEDGIDGDSHCDGTGPLVIKIFWHGRGSENNQQATRFRYTLKAS